MRQIVVGRTPVSTRGIKRVPVWFRYQVPAGNTNRVAYYAKLQANTQSQAPGDYAGADSPEVTALQRGEWVEEFGFEDVLDPTLTAVQAEARLVNLYNAAKADWLADDNAEMAFYATSFDGTAWSTKSA